MPSRPRSGLALAAGLAFLALAGCEDGPLTPAPDDAFSTDGLTATQAAGHGAPTGGHDYQLNIIGVKEDHSGGLNDNNGHRIFVALEGTSRIYLEEGEEFEVLDSNALDDGRATFQMPDTGLERDGEELTDDTSAYSVFVRGLGKPGGSALVTTCAEMIDLLEEELGVTLKGRAAKDVADLGDAECSVAQHSVTIESTKGNRKFQNVTSQLLTLNFEIFVEDEDTEELVGTGEFVQVPIFDDAVEGVFWEYDNNGLRLAQVRFYPCETVVGIDEDGNPTNEDGTCFD